MDMLTLPLVHCLVERSNAIKLNVHVPEHELAVLRIVHGASNVHRQPVDEEYGADEAEFDIRAEFEWARLINTYARKNAPDPAPFAYPRGAEDLAKFGFTVTGELAEAPPASFQVDHRREARKAKKKAGKAGK